MPLRLAPVRENFFENSRQVSAVSATGSGAGRFYLTVPQEGIGAVMLCLDRAAHGRLVSTTRRATAARRWTRTTPRPRARSPPPGRTAQDSVGGVLDDAVDEGVETFTLRVSKAVSARIVVIAATGAIEIVNHRSRGIFLLKIGLFLIHWKRAGLFPVGRRVLGFSWDPFVFLHHDAVRFSPTSVQLY